MMEYLIEYCSEKEVKDLLENKSIDGWELVSVLKIENDRELYFKRPLKKELGKMPDFILKKIKKEKNNEHFNSSKNG